MAKNETEIKVITVFDGELDATDVFIGLIKQKYNSLDKKNLENPVESKYNLNKVHEARQSGLCGYWPCEKNWNIG